MSFSTEYITYSLEDALFHDQVSKRDLSRFQVDELILQGQPVEIDSASAKLIVTVKVGMGPGGAVCNMEPSKKRIMFSTNQPIQTLELEIVAAAKYKDRFFIRRAKCNHPNHIEHVKYPTGTTWNSVDFGKDLPNGHKKVRLIFKMSGFVDYFDYWVDALDVMPGGSGEFPCDPQVGNDPPKPGDE